MEPLDPFAPVQIWHSEDWRPDGSEDLPLFRSEWAALLQQCRTAVARRETAYPQLVRAGTIDREIARDDLIAWRLLAAEWQWIVTGEGECPGFETLRARIAAVDLALDRVEAELARRRTPELLCQRHLLDALAWHLGDGRASPAIHHTARFHHARRAAPPSPSPADAPLRSAA